MSQCNDTKEEGNRYPSMTEMLYNGICLQMDWPPKNLSETSREPLSVPYLKNPPSVIPINVGRQVFVDDFLIEHTTLHRSFHTPRLYEHSPILKPETSLEMNNGICPVACPFNDGVFYDPKDQLFKMWYHAGWFDGIGYAISKDGLHWERPMLDVEPGTNRVLAARGRYKRDGVGVWLDHDVTDPAQRWKMFAYFRTPEWEGGEVYTSPDGIHWGEPTRTGPCGDNTTFFYNPFRKMWVYSIRGQDAHIPRYSSYHGQQDPQTYRFRCYREHCDFIEGARWDEKDVVFWIGADELDLPHPLWGYQTQLYNVDAVAYESVMLGLFQIHQGPPNSVCEEGGFPKITELMVGFSRDGFHWDRTNRHPFIASSQKEGTWNRAYLHSAGGSCLIVGDEIYFYFGAWSGLSPKLGGHMYAGGSTGLALLRRDGFASLDADTSPGSLTTRLVTFKGKYLFVNTNTKDGELRVEILDQNDQVIVPFSSNNCHSICTNKTMQMITWQDVEDVSPLIDKPVKFKFDLTNGQLYSFWVSPDLSGASYGYIAAGGPGFTGPLDTIGVTQYH
jgi:hypothetical protein